MEEEKELTKEQRKEIFYKSSPEIRLAIIKSYLDMATSAIEAKMGMLPLVSTLSIAMLIVATLNPDVIPISTFGAKILISILLFTIPFSLTIFYFDKEKEVKKASEYMGEWTGKNPQRNLKPTLWDKIIAYTPISIVGLYWVIVIFLWWIMWK